MSATTPDQVHAQWAAAMNNADVEAVLATYTPDTSMVAQPGQVVTGTEAIRTVINGMLAIKPRITMGDRSVIPYGDLALVLAPWTMTGTGPDGAPVEMAGTASDVVRRDPDGAWRIIIDNPFGTA